VAGNTFTRRRAILLLALTSVILITMDLRGSALINLTRSTFGIVFRPIEGATRVVTRPMQNAWNGMTHYNEVVDENHRLKDLIAYGEGANISAIASVREAQELLSLNGLPTLAGISSCTGQVVGQSPSNFSQTVEINRGSECGIKVGMPVLNAAGMIGKITDVYNKRSVVMLITDPSYSVAVKVVNAPPTTTTTLPSETVIDPLVPTTTTTTSTTTTTTIPRTTTTTGVPGFTPGATIVTVATTTIPGASPEANVPAGPAGPNQPGKSTKSPITVPAGLDLPLRETGALEGRGLTKFPVVRFVENQTRFGGVSVGSPVITAGGATSLAPPDIVIGTVSKVVKRSGSLGPILEVKLAANLDNLNFVRILLYQPTTERVAAP
jgi:rod shape-determining protein MreC